MDSNQDRKWYELIPADSRRARLLRWVSILIVVCMAGGGLAQNLYNVVRGLTPPAALLRALLNCSYFVFLWWCIELFRFIGQPLPKAPWIIRYSPQIFLLYIPVHLVESGFEGLKFLRFAFGDPEAETSLGFGIQAILGFVSVKLFIPLMCLALSQAMVILVPWIEAANREALINQEQNQNESSPQ